MDGYQEALRRIEKEAREKTGKLDLSRLDLTLLPAEIARLTHLQSLYCWGTVVSDLSPIKKLTNLQILHCHNTQISDLSPLQKLTNLQVIQCSETQISDLSPLHELGNLEILHFLGCTITTGLRPILALPRLRTLILGGAPIPGIPASGVLSGRWDDSCLERLRAYFTDTKQGIDARTKVLTLGGRPALGMSSLSNTPNQQASSRTAGSSGTVRQSFIHGLGSADTAIARIKREAKKKTGRLDLRDFALTSLPTEIASLTHLKILLCDNTQISDLSLVKTLSNLQALSFSNTQVSNLSPVNTLSLKTLICFNCPVTTSLEALLDAQPNLKSLVLGGVPIPGIPAGVLSENVNDNCLNRLRAHFDDLRKGGEANDAHIKLLILGNGRVGKTQITRCLCHKDFTFNPEWDSTHGIRIGQATLPAIDDVPVTLSVWDFGGQDVYHGTHALFLNSPAILALIWDKEAEERRRHGSPDQWFRDYPLPYWLALARQQGDVNSPIIAVQSKCDTVRSEAAPTIQDPESVSNLRFPWRPLSLSAKTGYGWSGFTERLQAAVAWMRDPDHVGMPKIGAGRKRVREKLIALRETQNLLSMAEFEALCKEDGDISSPDAMLSWLHADGTVYYRRDLFNDQIVLDQQWALDAIYALFDRERGALKTLRETRGRFTREVLARLVWQGYSQDEQDLFLSMMVSCGICFKHRMVREVGREVQEYITPDLLPDRAVVTDDVARHWKDGDSGEQASVSFPILHGGLIRTILSDIGGGKGSEHALYWNRGILARDGHSQSHFIIEQPEDNGELGEQCGWRGSIHIRTQGDKAADLLSHLLKMVHSTIDRIGLKGGELDSSIPWSPHGDQRGGNSVLLSLVAMRPWNRNWFVSYAWDEQVFFVDCLCDAAKAHEITILRDKNEIKLGDSIHGFMNKLRDGERVFVVLSDKYLRSANCMYELAEIWDRSKKDPEQFLPRICLWTMPDAKIWTPTDRAAYAVHWREQFNKLNAMVKEHGEEILGPSDRTALRNMRRFSTDVGEILATFADRIQPRTWADIIKKGFAD